MAQELDVTVSFASGVDRDAALQAIHNALANHPDVSSVTEESSGRGMTGGEIALSFAISIAAGLTIEGVKLLIKSCLTKEQEEQLDEIEVEDMGDEGKGEA